VSDEETTTGTEAVPVDDPGAEGEPGETGEESTEEEGSEEGDDEAAEE
jgi:hypothetical protein